LHPADPEACTRRICLSDWPLPVRETFFHKQNRSLAAILLFLCLDCLTNFYFLLYFSRSLFLSFENLNFVLVSNFEFRASNLS